MMCRKSSKKPPRVYFAKVFWDGGLYEGGGLFSSQILPGPIIFFYLRLVSMLETADILGCIVFKAILKPEYLENYTTKFSQK